MPHRCINRLCINLSSMSSLLPSQESRQLSSATRCSGPFYNTLDCGNRSSNSLAGRSIVNCRGRGCHGRRPELAEALSPVEGEAEPGLRRGAFENVRCAMHTINESHSPQNTVNSKNVPDPFNSSHRTPLIPPTNSAISKILLRDSVAMAI